MKHNRTSKSPRRSFNVLRSILGYSLVFWSGRIVAAQAVLEPDKYFVPPEILNQPPDHRSAHAHTADMICCKPCVPTEADEDPDVAKRPCFLRALGKARVNHGIFWNADPNLPGDRIPKDEQAQFNRYLEQVLDDECLPRSWIAAQRSALGTAYAPDEAWIEVVSWEAPIGEVMASRVRRADIIKLRLKVSREHRMVVRTRPTPGPDFDPDVRVIDEKNVFFDVSKLNDVLSGLFGRRFATPDDYVVRGGTRDFEGVRVFVGNVFSKGREPTNRHWYNRLRLLVTDSDPQYVGVVIDLRAGAKKQRTDE